MSAPAVTVVLPSDVDDPAVPSGGNRYDRRMIDELSASGWSVREARAAGGWPSPSDRDRAALAAVLAALPDGESVVIDGLIGCAAPEVVVPQAERLDITVLVHLPLAEETGLDVAYAADLDDRERRTLHAVSSVIATSSAAARGLAARHGLCPDRVRVAAPGCDPADLAPGTDGVSALLCVASVTPRKGHDLLVKALGEVAERPWNCVCAGALDRAPAHVAGVRASVRAHGLVERVAFTGPLAGAELNRAYRTADLVVLPSRAETYGMVVTEALSYGIPVLATETDGVPESMGRAEDGTRPGLLVPADDARALADGLRMWFEDADFRDRAREAARSRRGSLTGWVDTAARIAEVLRR